MNEIQLVQNPIIKHQLHEVGVTVTKRIEELNLAGQIATDDTIQGLKKLRAELVKEAKEFEDSRKFVKESILNPYNEFELVYKTEIIEKYKGADEILKTTIGNFELKLRTEKRNNIVEYFNELISIEKLDWLKFEDLKIEIQLSITPKKYKEMVYESVVKIISDIDLINTEEFAAEILVLYKKTLNAAATITEVRKRKEAERLETERLKMKKNDSRKDKLRSLTMFFSDLTKTFNYVSDETIFIRLSDIENLQDSEFLTKFVEIESQINALKTNITEHSLTPKVEPLQAPKVETKAEIFTAAFEVNETMERLNLLKQFLQSNNFNYKNI